MWNLQCNPKHWTGELEDVPGDSTSTVTTQRKFIRCKCCFFSQHWVLLRPFAAAPKYLPRASIFICNPSLNVGLFHSLVYYLSPQWGPNVAQSLFLILLLQHSWEVGQAKSVCTTLPPLWKYIMHRWRQQFFPSSSAKESEGRPLAHCRPVYIHLSEQAVMAASRNSQTERKGRQASDAATAACLPGQLSKKKW